jgi:hypothetical protein
MWEVFAVKSAGAICFGVVAQLQVDAAVQIRVCVVFLAIASLVYAGGRFPLIR